MNFGEQICVPSDEISFETCTPIWSHVSENENKIGKKSKNWKFHNFLTTLVKDSP